MPRSRLQVPTPPPQGLPKDPQEMTAELLRAHQEYEASLEMQETWHRHAHLAMRALILEAQTVMAPYRSTDAAVDAWLTEVETTVARDSEPLN